MGGEPKTALNLVGYPDDKIRDFGWLQQILQGGAERCKASGTVIVGGHTVRDAEIKFGMAVTGLIHPKKILTNANAKPGDKLVLTKPLGTGFVTTAAKANSCPQDLYDAAVASMVQLNAAGRDAMVEVGVNAATDITGFGLAGHAFEMAEGSRVTILIELEKLPLLPGVDKLVRKGYQTRASKTNREFVQNGLQLDASPKNDRLELIFDAQTSGGLLISVPAERADTLVQKLREKGTIVAEIIGEVRERQTKPLIVV